MRISLKAKSQAQSNNNDEKPNRKKNSLQNESSLQVYFSRNEKGQKCGKKKEKAIIVSDYIQTIQFREILFVNETNTQAI